MKKMIVTGCIAIFSCMLFIMPTLASAINNLAVIHLAKIKENSLQVTINHPYKEGSGNCSIVIRSRYLDKNLFEILSQRFQFDGIFSYKPTIDSSVGSAIIFKLTDHTYIDGITISTKDGKSIAENMAVLFPPNELINEDIGVMAGVCS